MTYKEARVYLDNASKYGSVLGLDTIRDLLGELGNPQDELKFIHIAGTNGKGSVLAYISTILSEAGYRVGRYVSPTVISYLERIQTDGRWIGEDDFAESAEKVQKAVARMETDGKASPTVFEMETAIAFLYFRKMRCDYVVLETGLGGREDATNIVKNTVLAVFATISRDHMGVLGDTLEEIAAEKAGIIKPGCKVVSAAQEPCVRKVLEQKARECRCPITFAESEKAVIEEESWQGQRFSYKEREDIHTALAGKYQILNAITALEAVTALEDVSEDVIRRGLEKTVWAGRFTCLREKPLFIVDGAHNEDAAKQLRQTVEKYFAEKRLIFIMGVFKDKEYEKIARIMGPLADRVYTVDLPDKNRTLDAESLKDVLDAASLKCVPDAEYEKSGRNVWHTAERIGNNTDCAAVESAGGAATSSETVCERVTAVGDIEKAVRMALKEASPEDVVLAFGSLSYLGRVMEIVKRG